MPVEDPNPDESEDQKKQVDFLRLYIDRKNEQAKKNPKKIKNIVDEDNDLIMPHDLLDTSKENSKLFNNLTFDS